MLISMFWGSSENIKSKYYSLVSGQVAWRCKCQIMLKEIWGHCLNFRGSNITIIEETFSLNITLLLIIFIPEQEVNLFQYFIVGIIRTKWLVIREISTIKESLILLPHNNKFYATPALLNDKNPIKCKSGF